jgi:HEAT repeat protein
VAALTAALGATNAALRGTAVVSLGQIGGDAAADALRDLLKRETNDDVRSAAAGSLRAIEKTKPAKEVRSGNG